MKKIIVLIVFLFASKVYAIENIEINNGQLIPSFNKEFKVYNFFTSSDSIIINVKYDNDEVISGSGYHKIEDGKNSIVVSSSNNEEYLINVFKNYKKNNSEATIENIIIKNDDINFNKNVYDYYVSVVDEDCLDIEVLLTNDQGNYEIDGNCNFDKEDNIVSIKMNDLEYTIHVLKSIPTSIIKNEKYSVKEMSSQKKEIIILIIIIISCIIVFIYFYSLFINKTSLHI